MTDELQKAVSKLHDSGCAIVVANGEKVIASAETSLKPLIEIVKTSPEILRGAAVADKIVGKAAALLLVHSGVREVYAEILSDFAVPVLERAGIQYHYNKKVPFIKNRAGDDTCPMEKKVLYIDDPETAVSIFLNL
ncbi:MAG: DUF1893 domain-containing protein [Clostridiales bacterium]|jgi:copper homeostasis protein CutC|nr:DUF1893 domain-containing protein [Clostridiales bacterium]HOA33149.1 DUF1893 domain-containing protein [Clostridiales bacterium]HOJ34943.1 DUF1893 domain-containing protein [Clostridiales bacterium]HOL78426.1 DUF1893 domain-containing protein [Clostridiales bacterium]HPP68397.1 DUF1893 domain-containing protein [Clostridiales bacterium]